MEILAIFTKNSYFCTNFIVLYRFFSTKIISFKENYGKKCITDCTCSLPAKAS